MGQTLVDIGMSYLGLPVLFLCFFWHLIIWRAKFKSRMHT